jgi:proton glutamate symport protein
MRRPSQTTQIFIGLALGIAVGALWPDAGIAVRPLSDVFLRLIKMILAPLIFSTLVVGIAGTGELKAVGRIGLKAIVWFELATTVALAVGLLMVNVVRPGAMLTLQPGGDTATAVAMVKQQQGGWDLVLHLVPTSVVDAMARERGAGLVSLLDSVAQVMFKVTGYVMRFAPAGVFGAMAGTIGGHGLSVLASLGALVGTLYAALFLYVVIVVGAATLLVRVPTLRFLRAAREPFLIAFSTASSEAALPKALEAMEQFGVPKRIASFVLPTGYSFNLDGSTLYLSAASIFVAQAAGVELSIGQQITMMLTLMVTSKGVAGVPRASLVILAATLSAFHLPLEGIALLLGVDQVLDMARTGVNVLGNCLASVVVARWEGEFDDGRMRRSEAA